MGETAYQTKSQQADAASERWLRMTPAERTEGTQAARDALFRQYLDQIPVERIDPDERIRRAEELRRIHMRKMRRRRDALRAQLAQVAASIDATGDDDERDE
jgi:hypothetical protein